MTTDSAIIAGSFEDPEVFGVLFDRHAVTIRGYVARQTDATTADDVVAETFLVAFTRRAFFDATRADARPWLFGIAINVLRRNDRRQRRLLEALPRLAAEDDTVDPTGRMSESLDQERELVRVRHQLSKMPYRLREVLLLFAWAEMTHEQIAEALDIPTGTVKSRLNRARRFLGPRTTFLNLSGDDHERPRPAPATRH